MPDEKNMPPNGYEKPPNYKGPHRSDPDFGADQNPATAGLPHKEPEPTKPKEE
jgi:hypothetical protein